VQSGPHPVFGIDHIDFPRKEVEAADGRFLQPTGDRHQFSDEGGRFFHTVSRYEVILWLPDALSAIPEDFGVWLTLGQLKALVETGELVSNEARSALSMLLPYL
jgi:hypothetical protein